MTKRKIYIAATAILIVWMSFFITDFCLAKANKSPIFAIPIVSCDDGGSTEFYGLGYKVIKYVSISADKNPEIVKVDIGTWFMKFSKKISADESYNKISSFLKEESTAALSQYYELLNFQISNYAEKVVDDNIKTTFFYTIIVKNFDTNPDSIDYIKAAKDSGDKSYQILYDEYLQPKELNFDLKAVIDKNDNITLYANVSGDGVYWEKMMMSDFTR